MIVSVSRRTDIPAFFSDWFYNRIKEGYVKVYNPYNKKQVLNINLSKENIDCFVFWTKNPETMLSRLSEIKEYNYYFQFTLTPYGKDIEPGLPNKEKVINTFIKLSKLIGKERIIWRYDPIIITNKYDINYHKNSFEYIASKLHRYTNRCVISFVDMYKKIERSIGNMYVYNLNNSIIDEVAKDISFTAKKYSIDVFTCSEHIDLSKHNIFHGSCIDGELINKISGKNIIYKKDNYQRKGCNCVTSKDIGVYNTCLHKCKYCYANRSLITVDRNILKHNKYSPFLID